MSKTAPAVDRIRALNDMVRQTGIGGKIMTTSGFASLDENIQQHLLEAIRNFDDFTQDNDPYGEHDCAIVSWEGYRVMFKFDYYDLTMSFGSEDPADSNKTTRVMTIMFPEEY